MSVNGGITTNEQMAQHLQHLDGVMLGPRGLSQPVVAGVLGRQFFAEEPRRTHPRSRSKRRCATTWSREAAEHGTPWATMARHMLGLRHGLPGARRWRQVWSDHRLKTQPPHEVMALAHEPVAQTAAAPPPLAPRGVPLLLGPRPAPAIGTRSRDPREIMALGFTTVTVEQNAIAALHLLDRALILDMGEIVFDGTAQDVIAGASQPA